MKNHKGDNYVYLFLDVFLFFLIIYVNSTSLLFHEGYRFGIKSSPGVSYEVIKQRMTWSEAERVCNKRYGHLATITSTVMNGELVARLHKE